MNRNTIRAIQPDLHTAAEHHAVHGTKGMSQGDLIAYRVKVEAVIKAIRDLREFQVLHDCSPQTAAVRGLLLDRFPASDEHMN